MTNKKTDIQDVLPEEREVFEKYEESEQTFKESESIEHPNTDIEVNPELEKSVEEQIKYITSKCTFNEDYVKNNIILSVNHLKQFFFFGKGPKKYKLKAVHDVNFQIKEGECFGIVGESGCGKTTTGRSIIRLYNITSGSIYYKGYRIGAGSRWNEKEIKYTKIRFRNLQKELKGQIAQLNVQLKDITKTIKTLLDELKLKNPELFEKLSSRTDSASIPAYDGLSDEEISYYDLLKRQNEISNEISSLEDKIDDARQHCENICAVQKAKIAQIKADNRRAPNITVNGDKIDAAKVIRQNLIDEMNGEIDKLGDDQAAIESVRTSYNPRIKEVEEYIDQLKATNKKLMSEIQMIFQDPIDSLDPRMTVEDIIQEGLKIQGHTNKAENHKKVVEALEKVGLIADYANRYPHEFSGGQRQRIGIARALIMNPKLLICDEPISALDVSIRAQIINLLNDLKEEMGLSIIFIAHDLSVVKYFCDRIAVMYFGEIVELATSDELFKHPLHPYTQSLLSAIPKPNPRTEKNRKRIVYKPQEVHDYSVEKPKLVEILPNHWILANTPEIEKYKEEIADLDKKAE